MSNLEDRYKVKLNTLATMQLRELTKFLEYGSPTHCLNLMIEKSYKAAMQSKIDNDLIAGEAKNNDSNGETTTKH